MRILIWFRADLRLRDNPMLYYACRESDRGIVAAFVISNHQWQQHDWGAPKADFVLRNVQALSEQLQTLNIGLRIVHCPRFEDVPAALLQLARAHACDALYYNREYELNERRRDERVKTAFEERGLITRCFTDQVLFEPGQILTQKGNWYTVFTPFRKQVYAALKAGEPIKPLRKPAALPQAVARADKVPIDLSGFSGDAKANYWAAGEAHARRLLKQFCNRKLQRYDRLRDFPAEEGTSTLSPYLSAGVVSIRQCLHAAVQANDGRISSGKKGPVTWISELIWREFYRHVVVGFERVCKYQPFKPETAHLQWNDNEDHFQAWCEGRCGVPIVDAAMRQLRQTGWMHNRLRMIVAMFLTKDLFIDWRRGERFFMQHLVDADLASNNGGWQWSASTGTDAAPYFRIFNPYSQSKKYDPTGHFIRKYVPELEALDDEQLHEVNSDGDLFASRLDYPPPIVDHAQARQFALRAFKRLQS